MQDGPPFSRTMGCGGRGYAARKACPARRFSIFCRTRSRCKATDGTQMKYGNESPASVFNPCFIRGQRKEESAFASFAGNIEQGLAGTLALPTYGAAGVPTR